MRSVRATLRGRAKIFKRAREVVFSLRTQLVSRRKDGGGGSSRAAVGDGRTEEARQARNYTNPAERKNQNVVNLTSSRGTRTRTRIVIWKRSVS